MSGYRVGLTYGVHVYQGDRPVATFFDADEAAAFVAAVNGLGGTEGLVAAPEGDSGGLRGDGVDGGDMDVTTDGGMST